VFKYFKRKCWAYISTSYVFTKLFPRNPNYYLACAKKIKFGAKIRHFKRHLFVFLAHGTKNVSLLWNCKSAPRMWRYMSQILFPNFLTFWKFIFWIKGASTPRIKTGFYTNGKTRIWIYNHSIMKLNGMYIEQCPDAS
jgi:hypothetical protein